MFATALLPVALREPAARLADMLAFLRNFDTTRVLLLHITTGPVSPAAELKLDALRTRVLASLAEHATDASHLPALSVEARVRSGSPAYQIAATAEEEGADFIYFPWKRKSWIQRTLVGSTTKDVIRLSNRPVFVWKPRRAPAEDEPFRVLYPTNFQDTDRYVVPYLQYPGLAADELLLLNVRERAPDPMAESRERTRCEENLTRLAEEVSANFTDVHPLQRTGNPRHRITRAVAHNGISFLILGQSDRQDALSAMMGSVAEAVAHAAPCSVFIVSRAYQPARGESA